MPPVETTYFENKSENNYSNSNDMLSYEQTAHVETPPKRNSIKNIINDDYEALSYEPQPTYIAEQQPAGNLGW